MQTGSINGASTQTDWPPGWRLGKMVDAKSFDTTQSKPYGTFDETSTGVPRAYEHVSSINSNFHLDYCSNLISYKSRCTSMNKLESGCIPHGQALATESVCTELTDRDFALLLEFPTTSATGGLELCDPDIHAGL